jgi:hypothetical protein
MTKAEVFNYISYCIAQCDNTNDCACCLGMLLLAGKLELLTEAEHRELTQALMERKAQFNNTYS